MEKQIYNANLKNFLSYFAIDKRNEQFQKVISDRTRYITVVLENIFQAQNASAVLRSCDIFGIQDIHVIENFNEFKVDTEVTMGASKWLNLYNYDKTPDNTLSTISLLREKGYRIVATTPHKNDVTIENFDLQKGKIALFFGSEHKGLSPEVLNYADDFVKIPMFGFTESLNISVAAAIILQNLTDKLRKSDINWQLSEPEKDEILIDWLKKSVKMSKLLVKEFERKNNI